MTEIQAGVYLDLDNRCLVVSLDRAVNFVGQKQLYIYLDDVFSHAFGGWTLEEPADGEERGDE